MGIWWHLQKDTIWSSDGSPRKLNVHWNPPPLPLNLGQGSDPDVRNQYPYQYPQHTQWSIHITHGIFCVVTVTSWIKLIWSFTLLTVLWHRSMSRTHKSMNSHTVMNDIKNTFDARTRKQSIYKLIVFHLLIHFHWKWLLHYHRLRE